jgi:Na+/melibiose symporter-like transporter
MGLGGIIDNSNMKSGFISFFLQVTTVSLDITVFLKFINVKDDYALDNWLLLWLTNSLLSLIISSALNPVLSKINTATQGSLWLVPA